MLVEIVLGLLTLLFISYLYLRFWKWTFFSKKGIFQIEPSFPFGNFNDLFIWVTKLTLVAVFHIERTNIIGNYRYTSIVEQSNQFPFLD